MSLQEDRGDADPALRAVLGATMADRAAYHRHVLAAVREARWLVPVTRMPDHSGDVATTLLAGPDGERTLPAFSGLDSLAAWRSDARPVPVSAAALADAAVSEQCELVVLDLAGPSRYVLTPGAVASLATGGAWEPPATRPELLAALTRLTALYPEVRRAEALAGERPDDVVVMVRLDAELSTARLRVLVSDTVAECRLVLTDASLLRVVPVAVGPDGG